MRKSAIKEITARIYGHMFAFYVMDSGRVEYCIDNGKIFTAKKLQDGRVFFIKRQEIIVKDEILEIGSVELVSEDFAALKEAQEEVLEKKRVRNSEKLDGTAKGALGHIDSWKRKIRGYREKEKKGQKYCIHDFRIGNNKYRFIERQIPGTGIVINPDYRVVEDAPDVGGVPKKYGELMFWDYFFEDKGWQRVRPLTNNELICLEVIREHGYFASQAEKQK